MSTDPNFSRERRAEAESTGGPSAYQPNALPLGRTGSRRVKKSLNDFRFGIFISHFPSDGVASLAVKGLKMLLPLGNLRIAISLRFKVRLGSRFKGYLCSREYP